MWNPFRTFVAVQYPSVLREAKKQVLVGTCPSCEKRDLHWHPDVVRHTDVRVITCFACFACFTRFTGTFTPSGLREFSYDGTITEGQKRMFRPRPIHEDWGYLR